MSDTKRTADAIHEPAPNSARNTPASRPTGAPISVASPVWIRLPTIGLSRPPPPPGGEVMRIRVEKCSPPVPRTTRVARMERSAASTIAVATAHSTLTDRLTQRRRRARPDAAIEAAIASVPPPVEQDARAGQGDKGDHHQDQAECEQGRQLQAAGRAFGKFQRDQGGDRVARRKQAGGDPVG